MVPSGSRGSSATRAVTQVLSSKPACGGHPPSGNCRARTHSRPRLATTVSPAASSARMAYTVGSVHDAPWTYGQPPSRFCLLTSSAVDIKRLGLAKLSEVARKLTPAVFPNMSGFDLALAAARQQYDERHPRPQPDSSLHYKVHE